ncbi:MAG TPA: hypothetical protein VFS08_14545 [Gemmatimonadaceae bacterium]|nr:hypothetical protein [Gemmatimonadaceae bacterium]
MLQNLLRAPRSRRSSVLRRAVVLRPSAMLAALTVMACGGGSSPTTDGRSDGDGGTGPIDGPPADATITLAPTARFQTMRGWEATAQAGQEEIAAFPQYRDALPEWAVDSVGLDRLRLEIRSGAENPRDSWGEMRAGRLSGSAWRCLRYEAVNDDASPTTMDPAGFHFGELDLTVEQVVLPMKRRLEARGERLFLNVNYVAFVQQCPGVRYDHRDPAEYAEFVLATVQHLRDKYGLVPDAWEVILEPDTGTPWHGAEIGAAIVAADQRLRAAGFDVDFIAPSTTSMANAVPYADELATRVPAARPLLAELSYHRYTGVSDANLRAIAERAAAYGTATAMLEHMGADHEELHRDLAIGNVSAWQQFVLAYTGDDEGDAYLKVGTTGGTPSLRLGSRTRYLRRYFQHVRRGAVRIGAASDDEAFAPLAFVNPDDRYTVVVKTTRGGTVGVRGLPAGRYGVASTTADEDGSEPDVTIAAGGELRATIPDRGVLVIFRR